MFNHDWRAYFSIVINGIDVGIIYGYVTHTESLTLRLGLSDVFTPGLGRGELIFNRKIRSQLWCRLECGFVREDDGTYERMDRGYFKVHDFEE